MVHVKWVYGCAPTHGGFFWQGEDRKVQEFEIVKRVSPDLAKIVYQLSPTPKSEPA